MSRRPIALLTVAGLVVLAAGPAYAQSVGGDIGGFIQNIIDLLNNNVIRGLAIIAIIVVSFLWLIGFRRLRSRIR